MFSAGRSPASLLLVCVPPRPTAAWLLLRSVVPYHSWFLLLLLRPSRQVRLLFLSTSLLSLGYPSPAPPSLFLAGYFDAQVSGFRYPSPAPPRLFLTGYFDAQVSLFRYPRAFFSLPVLVSLIVCFDALLFSHPTFPSRLLGWPACSLCRRAVRLRFFTAPLFLPLRFRWFFGGSALPPPSCLLPPSLHPLPGGSLLCRLAVRLRFLPLRGFYRSAVFTAQRFLPLSGFYRSAVFFFFFIALLSPVFWGLCSSAALMLAAPQSSPTSGRLALCAALRYTCGFTAPRFLPLRGFYRSAVFTAPRFLPLRFRRFFGGSALPPPSCLLPPSLRPLPGAPCGAGSSVVSPVGRHSWPSFCTACLTTLGALPLISPVSLLCISYTLGDRRSSRLLSVGTRAPRVLPPPSGTSRRMEIRHFHHRLTEVPSVDMLIEAWNGSIYRWHGVSLWCGFLHIPQIHAPPVPETR